jgi:UPF0755 protein
MATKKNKTGLGLKIFLWFLSISLACIISFLLYFASYINENIEPSGTITVPKGSISAVINSLSAQGYATGSLDALVVKISGGLKYGKFKLEDKNYTRYEFFKALSVAKPVEMDITLIPGETLEVFFGQIADKYKLSADALKKAYQAKTTLPDGVIFADTYTFKIDAKESEIVNYLLSASQKKHRELSARLLGRFDESEWYGKYVTTASIIQKEAVNESEMPIVSSVIYNRLAIGMPLQMDGSLNYGSYSHKKITPTRIREDESTYNTYKHKGLPLYPVCAVSSEALMAAVNPKSTDYLYFMRNKDGVHSFSKTFGAHQEIIESVKKSNRN